jgi:hypothetical protein
MIVWQVNVKHVTMATSFIGSLSVEETKRGYIECDYRQR